MDDAQAKVRYECVPYPSKPQLFVHPKPLAVLSTIFGGQPQAIERARVLEIGCADGSNAITIAHYLPGSYVVGIDVSSEAINRGRSTVDQLQLSNIELHSVDLRDYEPEGMFDYVLCHGLWSWVDEHTRMTILELIRRVLNPEGVALISYNTWPGWHTLRPARDVMQLVAERTEGNAQQLVHAGLDFLELAMPHIAQKQSVYGSMLSHATYTMEGHSDAYLFHDFLAPVNQPFYFRDFVAGLKPYGLAYLGEASFGQLMPYELPDDLEARIDALTPDLITQGQLLDFVRNTAFRVSLICPVERHINRSLDRTSVEALHVRTMATETASDPGEDGVIWETPDGSKVTAGDRLTLAILEQCRRGGRVSIPVAEIYTALCSEHGDIDTAIADQIAARLLRLYAAGVVDLSTAASPTSVLSTVRPKTTMLARFQLQRDEQGVSTSENTYVELGRFERSLLTLCDGSKSQDELLGELCALVKTGDLEVTIGGVTATKDSVIREVIAALLPGKLEHLARLGLVE